jgi:hypothetical protein
VVLLIFHLPKGIAPSEATKLSQRLYGRTAITWSGKYRYRRPGLLEGVPHRRVGRGILVLWARDAGKVLQLLGQVRAPTEVRVIEPLPEDLRQLRAIAR